MWKPCFSPGELSFSKAGTRLPALPGNISGIKTYSLGKDFFLI